MPKIAVPFTEKIDRLIRPWSNHLVGCCHGRPYYVFRDPGKAHRAHVCSGDGRVKQDRPELPKEPQFFVR